jgi:hypothetical protein
MKRIYEQNFIDAMRTIMLSEAKITSHPLNVSMEDIHSEMGNILNTMDKNDPVYEKMAKLFGSIQVVAKSTVKPNAVHTKHAKEPAQQKPIVNNGNPLEVGDILNDYFSYSMTFNRYYQVVAVKGKSVTAKAIQSKTVSSDGWSGQETPVKDAFTGEQQIFKLRGNFAKKTDVSIKSGNSGSGRIYYVEPKPDGTYPSNYYNNLD